MTLANEIIYRKLQFIDTLETFVEKIATYFFNYPEVLGMDVQPPYDAQKIAFEQYVRQLPVHQTRTPPPAMPTKLSEVFFGNVPEFHKITRTLYQHKKDGFYNIHIPDYQNIWFLPDWLSKWIQLNLEITVDVAPLEHVQQAIFVALVLFYFLIEFRVKLYWFLTINPYTRPWVYLIALTDWLNDWVAGMAPVLFGLDYSPTLVLMVIGKLADSLNHLVFTMPFLPSEGTLGRIMSSDKMETVILYRFLPSLWMDEPIPDSLREFWYEQRPDILKFMKKNYHQLDIDFEPNRILREMYDKEHINKPIIENITSIKELSTNLVSDISVNSYQIIDHLFSNSIHLTSGTIDQYIV
jgi:hypothetical protein